MRFLFLFLFFLFLNVRLYFFSFLGNSRAFVRKKRGTTGKFVDGRKKLCLV